VIYLYAYTNHKEDLDSLRRVKAIYDELKLNGIDAEILVNEYRAQLMAKEWGLPKATTIETIKDIDAVAKLNDIIVIDSPEELEGKVLNYPENFKAVIYINSTFKDITYSGAKVIDLYKDNKIVAPSIKSSIKEENKAVYIYGDSDPSKIVVENLSDLAKLDCDFYWGIYFYVKYEEKIKKSFNYIIESEDYYELFQNYNIFVTSNFQIAIEALFNKKSLYFINLKKLDEKKINFIQENGGIVINISDNIKLDTLSKKENVNLNNTNNLIYNIISSYM
jgi:hypothetical protein